MGVGWVRIGGTWKERWEELLEGYGCGFANSSLATRRRKIELERCSIEGLCRVGGWWRWVMGVDLVMEDSGDGDVSGVLSKVSCVVLGPDVPR